MGRLCPLGPSSQHTRFAGKRNRSGSYISRETARYSRKLAGAYAQITAPLVSKRQEGETVFPGLEDALLIGKAESAVLRVNAPPAYIKDGGGKLSTGDWSSVPSGELHREDEFKSLREKFLHLIRENDLQKKLVANMACRSRDDPWAQELTEEARSLLHTWLERKGEQVNTTFLSEIPPGQRFLLNLCIATAISGKDQDVAIWEILIRKLC